MTVTITYSYTKLSSLGEPNRSRKRLLKACTAFCKANGLALASTLQAKPQSGRSTPGRAIDEFMEMIETGRIPAGSVLIVESFDRVTPDGAQAAFITFTNILKAHVDIVTLADGQWYSWDTFKQQSRWARFLFSISVGSTRRRSCD
jgi:hypothetical protein